MANEICKICGVNKCRWNACDECKEKSHSDSRVLAVRGHKKVGRGTCTSIDECYDDHELVIALNESDVTTDEGAIKWALDSEGLHLENALNYRWGEDNDPELKQYNDWINNP